MKLNLKFPLSKHVKTSIFKRWIARRMCLYFLNNCISEYEFHGYYGTNGGTKQVEVMCMTSKLQIIQVILSEAGYCCSCEDIAFRLAKYQIANKCDYTNYV